MSNEKSNRICPVERAGGLDNSLRRFLQNPQRILKRYVHKGMTVLDFVCGPGFFSIEMANMVTDSGKIIAADVQEGMLEKVRNKIKGTELEQRIELHKCEENKIGAAEHVDFALAFYMIHEVPSQENLFEELKSILKPNGQLFIVEPLFHVSKKSFEGMLTKITNIGFEIMERPKIFFSGAVLLTKKR